MNEKQFNTYNLANTIDAVNDLLLIWTNSVEGLQNINRNTFLGLASGPVGLTDTQTLTNKVLTAPTVSAPVLSGTVTGTYTIGGTPTFPASVATLTGSQTLTNKTLTSPTINSPTITNASITADSLTGYTTSSSGTIYGGLTMTTGNAAFSGNVAVSGTLGVTGVATFTGGFSNLTMSNPYKFSVYLNGAQNTGNGAFAVIKFDTKVFDTGNNYSVSTGLFTAPIAGFYQFDWSFGVGTTGVVLVGSSLFQNGTRTHDGVLISPQSGLGFTGGGSALIQCAANDTISIQAYGATAQPITTGNIYNTRFNGFLVSAI